MGTFVTWHKKYIKWWKKKLNVSDYGILWISFINPKHSRTTDDSTHPPETEPEKSPLSLIIILLPIGLGEDPQV